MQKQLAPTGQLVPVNDKLYYQPPQGDRLLLEGDRCLDQLAVLLPQVQAGLVNGQQAQLVKQAYNEVLLQAASSYHELALSHDKNQQRTIDGLIEVVKQKSQPVIIQQQDDLAEVLGRVGAVTVIMAMVFLTCGVMVQRSERAWQSQPVHYYSDR